MTNIQEGFHGEPSGQGRRFLRGDGSALASFLCPICYWDVLAEEEVCDHLLLVRDRFGEIYCRDLRVRTMVREAEAETGERGERAVELLCERLGPSVVLYELIDPPLAARRTSVLFVVDVAGEARAAAG
ncbi:MAG: hypothetical protein NTY18_06250 [Deltaproteobacteria bacterium]|nr:hypothetical protein [Deltaproteobacteria bacterium]